jgi:hypothetical protein
MCTSFRGILPRPKEAFHDWAIQFEKQQTEQMEALALGYDKARIEAEQQLKTELTAQFQAVSHGNHLTYDNQQKAIDQLRVRYEQEFRDRLEAITNAQNEAREMAMGAIRAIIAAQAHQIREEQQKQLTEQTAKLHDELNKQQANAVEFQKEIQELNENTERRIDVLGCAPVQENQSPE